jgi:hypothetical protein
MRIKKVQKKQFIFGIVILFVAIILIECALHLLVAISPSFKRLLASPWTTIPATIPDTRLGHRPNPAYPGHD